MSTLSNLNADKLVEDKAADLSAYGLNSPTLDVTVLKKDGKTQDVYLGDDTPTSGGAYAKLAGDAHVYTVASYVKTSLEKTPNDLRDKRLLTFDQDKLTRVDLQQANGETIEFGKNNQNDWQILKPKPLRADGSQVEDLIRKLKDAKMDASVSPDDAKKAAAAFASGTKVAVATVTDSSGSQTLEVRKESTIKTRPTTLRAARLTASTKSRPIWATGSTRNWTTSATRNYSISALPTRTRCRRAKPTYDKVGEKWMSGAKQMDASSVQSLVDKLRDLTATKFVETGGGTPVLDLMVSSNNGKRIEKVSITKQGDTYFAKRENEPSIYLLDGKAVEDLQKAANDVKEFQPPKKK